MKTLNNRPARLLLAVLLLSFALGQATPASCGQSVSSSFAIDSHAAATTDEANSTPFGSAPAVSADLTAAALGEVAQSSLVAPAVLSGSRPFSRIAFGAGVSPLGIGLQVATNVNRHLNIRGTGNYFSYTDDGITTEGFNVTARVNLASAGASLDYYPFHKGFRLSPGVLFYNQNKADTIFVAASGTSFSLDNHTYYSASGANAVVGSGSFGLGNGRAAFTATTGWGNVIPASGRHFSFPFELGVAFIKQPTVALSLTGEVCDAQGQNCVNVATDTTAQTDLAAQIQKYQNDVNPLKTYPILSFGVAYNFRIR